MPNFFTSACFLLSVSTVPNQVLNWSRWGRELMGLWANCLCLNDWRWHLIGNLMSKVFSKRIFFFVQWLNFTQNPEHSHSCIFPSLLGQSYRWCPSDPKYKWQYCCGFVLFYVYYQGAARKRQCLLYFIFNLLHFLLFIGKPIYLSPSVI